MKSPHVLLMFLLGVVFSELLGGCATTAAKNGNPHDLPILQDWSGDYPLDQLQRLPDNQRSSPAGYLGDAATFSSVWQVFRPGETVPQVDFSRNLVVFCRNVNFYNRTSIAKVTLKDDGAEILAMETMSARPIEDKVAMSMAVIPRKGVQFIRTGDERIQVKPKP